MWADSTEQCRLQRSSRDGAEASAHMKPRLTRCVLPCSFISDCTRILVSSSASREPGLSVWFSSFSQSCPTLCDPMDCSTPGLPVHHQLLEFTQTHVHRDSDAVQPSHPLSSPPLPPPVLPASGAFPPSQCVAPAGQSPGASASASVVPVNTQDWSPLGWTGWISLQSKGLSRVFSNTTVQKHPFSSAQLSLWSSSHIHT